MQLTLQAKQLQQKCACRHLFVLIHQYAMVLMPLIMVNSDPVRCHVAVAMDAMLNRRLLHQQLQQRYRQQLQQLCPPYLQQLHLVMKVKISNF